ncbi:MAG: TldD/PmbA family protein [Clostridia bacterium]|nr:TldD/PmbA family protein [Clostridia bacterium]
MMDALLDILRASGADGWEVTDTATEKWEFYFIRHRLDQNRASQVQKTKVKVYRLSEDQQFLGSATGEIAPTATRAEAEQTVTRLLEQAALVKNPAYTLRAPAQAPADAGEQVDVAQVARDFIQVMQELPETETEDINSYEIFASFVNQRFISSTGIDVTSVYPSSMIEVVVNARKEGHEIELYRNYTSGTCDRQMLKENLAETLRISRDRLHTVPTPALGKADLVLSNAAAVDVYDWFISRMSAAMKYQGLSDWEIGQSVCEGEGGSKLTIRAVKHLKNSSRNAAYDAEGAPIRDLTLIDHGVAKNWWGSRQFTQYLKIEDAFIAGNFDVSGEGEAEEALRTGKYLEVLDFSDFQVDALTGDIAGEIRLGYWHDGEQVQIVSGGSVSGNMRKLSGVLRFSTATRQYDQYLIPHITRLPGVTITGGAEE